MPRLYNSAYPTACLPCSLDRDFRDAVILSIQRTLDRAEESRLGGDIAFDCIAFSDFKGKGAHSVKAIPISLAEDEKRYILIGYR